MMDFLYILEVIIATLLILVVLIQNKNVSLNLTSMSWGMSSTQKRWAENFLQNLTIFLWIVFVVNSVLLFVYM